MVALPIWMGVSPEKCGSAEISLPHSSSATPRRKMDAPMVMMMVATTEAPRAGAMAKRCSIIPTSMVINTARIAASHTGRPPRWHPPSPRLIQTEESDQTSDNPYRDIKTAGNMKMTRRSKGRSPEEGAVDLGGSRATP